MSYTAGMTQYQDETWLTILNFTDSQSVSTNAFSDLLGIKKTDKNYIWAEINLFLSIVNGMRLTKTRSSKEVCPSSVYSFIIP